MCGRAAAPVLESLALPYVSDGDCLGFASTSSRIGESMNCRVRPSTTGSSKASRPACLLTFASLKGPRPNVPGWGALGAFLWLEPRKVLQLHRSAAYATRRCRAILGDLRAKVLGNATPRTYGPWAPSSSPAWPSSIRHLDFHPPNCPFSFHRWCRCSEFSAQSFQCHVLHMLTLMAC